MLLRQGGVGNLRRLRAMHGSPLGTGLCRDMQYMDGYAVYAVYAGICEICRDMRYLQGNAAYAGICRERGVHSNV